MYLQTSVHVMQNNLVLIKYSLQKLELEKEHSKPNWEY